MSALEIEDILESITQVKNSFEFIKRLETTLGLVIFNVDEIKPLQLNILRYKSMGNRPMVRFGTAMHYLDWLQPKNFIWAYPKGGDDGNIWLLLQINMNQINPDRE